MDEQNAGRADPMASLSAFGTVAYRELVTVVAVSVLFSLAALPVVTLGAAALALVETVTAVVTGEGRGGPTTERERVRLFAGSFREHLRVGLPFSALLAVVVAATVAYAALAFSLRSEVFLVGGVLGLYAVVVGTAWALRAASLVVRAPPDRRPGFLAAMRDAAYMALDRPTYTALQLTAVAALFAVTGALRVAVPLLLPGALALVEVVAFADLADDGAMSVVRAYRGERQ